MRFFGRLLANVLGVLAGSTFVAWYVYRVVFPLADAQRALLGNAALAGLAAEGVVVAAVLAGATRRLRSAANAQTSGALGADVAAASAAASHRLPVLTSGLVGLVSLGAGGALVLSMARGGLADDLALAAAAVATASAILAAMLAYSVAASARARLVEALGVRVDVVGHGTVRGKILVVGFGLNTIGVLLFASAAYVRHRGDVDVIASIALAVYLATAVLAWFAARAITVPFRTLGRAADRIASGDLTASPPSVSRDEIGQLAGDFRRMAQGLQALVIDVQGASEGVSVGAREAAAIGERVRAGARDEHAGVVAVQAAVEAMASSVLLVSRGVGGLSEYVAATNRAMGEMAASFEQLSGKGSSLERGIEEAIADVDHLAVTGSDAEARLAHLESVAGQAGGMLSAVKGSVAALERAASDSEGTAKLVAEMAERAGGVVEETVHGIESLHGAVADAHRRVAALGRRSDDIDQVVDFIAEVAGRTNLLSLNASIIAAQAGEHGKPFGVVADQIRELAAQIARSTKSIADIVRSVREDVEGTAALIDRGDALAVEGVQLARNSLEALARIQRSTVDGRDTAAAIRRAVDAQVQSSGEVARLVESVAEGSRAVSGAVQLVGRGVAAVSAVARSVGAMADQVARALDDQSGLGKLQIDSLGRLEGMIAEIRRAVENHDAAARRVRYALQNLSQSAGAHENAVEGLSGVAERLGARARALTERVGRFKV